MYKWFGSKGWKWLVWNEVTSTLGTGLLYRMCFLFQPWSVGVELSRCKRLDMAWKSPVSWSIAREDPSQSLAFPSCVGRRGQFKLVLFCGTLARFGGLWKR